jgi:TRAP-type C4-dicarboxylate transport system substrate-binding protein
MKCKRENRTFHFKLLVVFIVLFSSFLMSAEMALGADKPIELKVLSAWTNEYVFVREWLLPYIKKLNERSDGRLKVTLVGPEAVPPFEQLRPISLGNFDINFTAAPYHMGEVSAGALLEIIKGTPAELREAGFYKLMDEAYEKVNVKVLGYACGDVGYHFVLKKKLAKADFTGFKIRATPTYIPLVKALGGATVMVPGGEVYSALEKGIVDGAAWPAVGALDYKWYEVSKYLLRPTFGEVHENLLINLTKWNSIPSDLQNLITQITQETEEEGYKRFTNVRIEEEKKLLSKGMELNVLPPEEGEKLIKTYYERSWEELGMKYSPEYAPTMKKMADQLVEKQKKK